MKMIINGAAVLAIATGISTLSQEVKADFPERPITVILPFGPGGGTDMITRTFDIFAKDVFGNNLIVEYRPGGGSAVGTTVLSNTEADGYTIGMGSLPHMYLQPAAGAGQYELDDFDYIGMIASEPQLMVTPIDSDYSTYEELKAAAQDAPGELTIGIPSPLSETWLAYMILNEAENLGFTIVTYQGGGALNAALLGNQVDAAVTNIGPVFGEIDNLNVVGVTSSERVSFLPNVPTFKEMGIEIETSVERVFMAPSGVSEDRLEVLRDGFKKIWDKPEFQERMEEMRFGMRWVDGEDLSEYLSQNRKVVLDIYNKTTQ